MIVLRSMVFALGVVALSVGEARAQAPAQDCAPTAILGAYRAADAAYARKDFATAAAGFRPLAEQGLGSAQLRLGQILAADPAKPDPVEAYRWLVLAADTGATGAKEALDGLKPRLSAQQIAQAKIDPATWQPAALWPCLAVDPRIKRPDGSAGYDMTLLVNHVTVGPLATGAPARREQWLQRTLESIRTTSPRTLIYLKALYGITVTGGANPFAIVFQRENLPVVGLNETFMDTVSPELQQQVVGATRYAVNVALVPPAVVDEVQTYKGVTIHTIATDAGKNGLALMKAGVDMIGQLPPDLAALARAATDLRYEPRRPYDRRAAISTLSANRRDPTSGQLYLAYSESIATSDAAHVVSSLVDYGINLRRSKPLWDAEYALEQARERGDAGATAKAEKQVADLKAARQRNPGRGDCELDDVEIKTMEALKIDPIQLERAYKRRNSHNCQ
jgi:hypothetical protein